MSSFFTAPAPRGKRKRAPAAADSPQKRVATSRSAKAATNFAPASRKRSGRIERRDESISGSESDAEGQDAEAEDSEGASQSEEEVDGETAAERRLRLAERYLDNVRQEVDTVGFDAEDIDRDIIAERLREDVAESKGRVYRKLASELAFDRASHTLFRSNNYSTTAVATCAPYAYTVTKDLCLVKWKLQDLPGKQCRPVAKRRPRKPLAPARRQPEKIAVLRGNRARAKDQSYRGHTNEILAVAASQDGKYVATGGSDRRLIVCDAKTLKILQVFTHHRDAITALVFRRGTNQLYSASKDRTVKVWSLDELAYVETLFGHQDHVVDIDALAEECCISVGARDRTARLWKVVEETQLVFRSGSADGKSKIGPKASALALEGTVDRVAMIDDDLFVTGSCNNGSIALWSIQKKKPLFTVKHAHGIDTPLRPEEASAEEVPDAKHVPEPLPRWVTALKTLPYSDVILSGSWDGYVRVWKLSEDRRRIDYIGALGHATRNASGLVDESVDDRHEWEPDAANGINCQQQSPWLTKGVVNDISVFERGDRGRDGLCVIAGVGKEHRLGRWKKIREGKNGAVVFEIPRVASADSLESADVRANGEK